MIGGKKVLGPASFKGNSQTYEMLSLTLVRFTLSCLLAIRFDRGGDPKYREQDYWDARK